MSTLNMIGLNQEKTNELTHKMNILLASLQVYYQNLRGFHWNIKGRDFFELHIKFEELYTVAQERIDEVAERILTLGYTPNHNYGDYRKTSKIKESAQISDGIVAVGDILTAFQTIIILERELLTLSADAEDEGTNALMSDYIRLQEKLVWMYSSFLNK